MVRTLRAAEGRQCAGVEAALCSTVSGSVTTRISARSGGRGPGREKSVGAVLVAVGRHIGVHDAGQWTLLAGECALSYSQPPQRCISHHIISYHIISYHLPPTNLGRKKTSNFEPLFRDFCTRHRRYLRNETSHRQTEMLMSICNVSPKNSPTFRDGSVQTDMTEYHYHHSASAQWRLTI